MKAIYSRFQVIQGNRVGITRYNSRIQLNNLTCQAGRRSRFQLCESGSGYELGLNAEPGPEPDLKLEPDTDTGPDPACPNLGNNDRLVIGSGIGSTILTHK